MLPDWAVGSGSVDIVPEAAGGWKPAQDGDYSLDLVGETQGSISQSFATVANATYTLSFWYSRNVLGSPDPSTADVKLTDGSFQWTYGITVDATQAGSLNGMLWTGYSHSFVGTGNVMTQSFTATNGVSQGGVFIDSVSVVPEPEAYGLALAGMGLVAFAMRRRKHDERFAS